MGYHSEVAFKAQFLTVEDRDKIINRLPEAVIEILKRENVQMPEDRPVVYFYYSGIKWYSTRELGGFGGGYKEIDAMQALVDACETANFESPMAPDAESDGVGVPNSGAFARIGEEYEDIDVRYWTANGHWDDLPDPFEMLSVQRYIDFSEDMDY